MQHLGVLKESERRRLVALAPAGVKRLAGHFRVTVQRGAGRAAGFSDEAYEEAGATLVGHRDDILRNCDVILGHDNHYRGEDIGKPKTFIGFLNVLNDRAVVEHYRRPGITLHSVDLIPRTTLAQAMDVLSSVASISGYQAVLLAAERSLATVPMITSAGGTLRPARFLIMGAGVSGLQAIATARRLGAIVRAYDVRSASRTEVESLGATFIEVEGAVEDRKAGGYAVEQTPEHLERIRKVIHEEAAQADVIITTARIPGRRAPLLITEDMVRAMKPGAVVVDLAAATGGNCALTEPDATVMADEVTIMGPTAIECGCAHSTSFLLSNNYTTFIEHLLKNAGNPADEILKATRVVEDGEVVNERYLALAATA
ncbi:MAG: NAD(P) transhydrogenase subunit alpha [Flavobacteriales bacterium]|jgi:NAD(P) transhydrogenase subunit alpha|nr:MAG: NAD(P) transhydrogenase subunit alpha [Flavobacteriales bacterium]